MDKKPDIRHLDVLDTLRRQAETPAQAEARKTSIKETVNKFLNAKMNSANLTSDAKKVGRRGVERPRWTSPLEAMQDRPLTIQSPKATQESHGTMAHLESLRGDDSHIRRQNDLRLYSMLGSTSGGFHNIESYQKVQLDTSGNPMVLWGVEIEQEVQKSRAKIEQNIGRKLTPIEWKKIATMLTEESRAQLMKEVDLKGQLHKKYNDIPVMDEHGKPVKVARMDEHGNIVKDANNQTIFDYVLKEPKPTRVKGAIHGDYKKTKHLSYGEIAEGVAFRKIAKKRGIAGKSVKDLTRGYAMTPEGPKPVYAMLDGNDSKWRHVEQIGNEAHPEHFILTDAGGKELEHVTETLAHYTQDAQVLRAMRQDVMAAADGNIKFENTIAAMQAGRHRQLVDTYGLKPDVAYDKYSSFHILQDFVERKMAVKNQLPAEIMLDEKWYMYKLGAHLNHVRDSVSSMYYGGNNGAYEAVAHKDMSKMTPEERAAERRRLRGLRQQGMTPFGKLQERKDVLQRLQSVTEQAYRIADEEERQNGPGADRGSRDEPAHGDQFRHDHDRDRDQRVSGNQIQRDEAELQRHMKQVESDLQMEKLAEELFEGEERDAEGNLKKKYRKRPMTPIETTRREALRQLEKFNTPAARSNQIEWEMQLRDNPEMLLQMPGDKSIHKPIGLPNEHGQIPTIRKHVIAKEAKFEIQMGTDRGVRDKGKRLVQAAQDLENARRVTDVEKLIEHPQRYVVKLGEQGVSNMKKYATENGIQTALEVANDGTVVLDRKALQERLVNGLWVNARDGKTTLPTWAKDTLVDRAYWLFGSHEGDLGGYFFEAVNNVLDQHKLTNLDFSQLVKDKHYLARWEQLSHVEDPISRIYMAASGRDLVNDMMRQFFDMTKRDGDPVNHNLTEIIKLYQEDKTRSGVVPTFDEVEELVRSTNDALKRNGFDHLDSTMKYLKQDWRAYQDQFVNKPSVSLDAHTRPEDYDRHYTDEIPDDGVDQWIADIEEQQIKEAGRKEGSQEYSAELRNMVEALERHQKESRPYTSDTIETAKLLLELRNQLPEGDERRRYGELARFYTNSILQQDASGIDAGERLSVLAELIDRKKTITLSSAEHGRQLVELIKHGMKFDNVSGIVDGEARYGKFEAGANGELFFRDNRDMPILVVDNAAEAVSSIDGKQDFDQRYIRKAVMEDYMPEALRGPEGYTPIVINAGNVREDSRAVRGSAIPQTMAETKMYMDDLLRNKGNVVSMDLETTLLPSGTKERQHMLEASLRRYNWDGKKLVAKDEARLLIKPDAMLRKQVTDMSEIVQEEVMKILNSGGNKDQIERGVRSVESLSFLRNLAKYAGNKTAKHSSDFDYIPTLEELPDYVKTVTRDANTALRQLDRKGTHTLEEALHAINDFIGDDYALIQNGGNAEKRWMDIFHERVDAQGGYKAMTEQEVKERQLKDIWANRKMYSQAEKQELEKFVDTIPNLLEHVYDGKLDRDSVLKAASYGTPSLQSIKTRMIQEAGEESFDREALNMLKGAKHGEMREEFFDLMKMHGRNLAGRTFDIAEMYGNRGGEASVYDYYHELANDSALDSFNPKMIELMHASRNYNDTPGTAHNMPAQMERLENILPKRVVEEYGNKKHFANVDTEAAAKLFEHYMKNFSGFTPEFLPEGALVAKVNSVGEHHLPHGVYTVGSWDEQTKRLSLINDVGETVHMPAAGRNELNALFQTNFVMATGNEDPAEFSKKMSAEMAWDTARRDIQDSNSYTEFMNNRIKYLAATHGNVDEMGLTPHPAVQGITSEGGETTFKPHIAVSENERRAAEHGAAYWQSAEADLKQDAFGRLKDMMDLGHVNQEQANEIMKRIDSSFSEIGGQRATREAFGYLDAGRWLDNYGGERFLIGARSQNEIYNDLWQAANRVMEHVKSTGPMTEDEQRNRAIREILIPHLSNERGNNLLPVMVPTNGDKLAADERISSLAKMIYEQHVKDKPTPTAMIDDIKPIITSENRQQAEDVMNAIFQEHVDTMSGPAQRAYARAQEQRKAMETAYGSMLPPDIRLAHIADDEKVNYDPGHRWNPEMKGRSIDEIIDMSRRAGTEDEKRLRSVALRELNSMTNRLMYNPTDREGLAAQSALGWTPGEDLGKAIMPVGQHQGLRMEELPDDYIRRLMTQTTEPEAENQQDLIRQYLEQIRRDGREYNNPYSERQMGFKKPQVRMTPGEMLGLPDISAVSNDTARDTIEETATDRAFKQAEDRFSRNPEDFIQTGRVASRVEAGLEQTGGFLRKSGGKALGIGALALAGAFLVGNMITDPGTWKRPNGDSPNPDGDYLDAPKMEAPQAPARVEDHGSGLDGMRIRVKGKAPGHMSNEQIGSMVGDGVRGSVPHQTNVNVSSRDDTSKVDHNWLKQTYTEFMKNGYVNG